MSSVLGQSTVFIVRHAEKGEDRTGKDDPDLTKKGKERAKSLANALQDAKITAIYVSEKKRTQQTAAPLKEKLGITPIPIPKADTASIAEKLKGTAANALVVGHSDTIPGLIKAFGISEEVDLKDQYDNLFIVTVEQKPRLLRLHYR